MSAIALALLALVVFQGMLGMLTVTWQLKPLIVTLHLLFGLDDAGDAVVAVAVAARASRGDMRFGGADERRSYRWRAPSR